MIKTTVLAMLIVATVSNTGNTTATNNPMTHSHLEMSAITNNNTADSCYLDMNTVIGYNVTDSGIMLYTADGNNYYLEILPEKH